MEDKNLPQQSDFRLYCPFGGIPVFSTDNATAGENSVPLKTDCGLHRANGVKEEEEIKMSHTGLRLSFSVSCSAFQRADYQTDGV